MTLFSGWLPVQSDNALVLLSGPVLSLVLRPTIQVALDSSPWMSHRCRTHAVLRSDLVIFPQTRAASVRNRPCLASSPSQHPLPGSDGHLSAPTFWGVCWLSTLLAPFRRESLACRKCPAKDEMKEKQARLCVRRYHMAVAQECARLLIRGCEQVPLRHRCLKLSHILSVTLDQELGSLLPGGSGSGSS